MSDCGFRIADCELINPHKEMSHIITRCALRYAVHLRASVVKGREWR